MKPFVIIFVALSWVPAFTGNLTRDDLFQPFQGFHQAGMAPIFELFDADYAGRTLLRKAWKKVKLPNRAALIDIMDFCSSQQLSGNRRGLFIQEKASFYRMKGEEDWREISKGTLAKLNNPKQFPQIAQRITDNRRFEHLTVAFRPKICIAPNLNVLQAYLVLYHELSHLVGLDPFRSLDLHDIEPHRLESDYYKAQLQIKGGEMDAYKAQLKAFSQVRKAFDLDGYSVLESFLSRNGRIIYSEKDAFLSHLLYEADYYSALEQYLVEQVYYQYNVAYAWWEYLDRYKVAIDQQLQQIDEHLGKLNLALEKAPESVELKEALQLWQNRRLENRREFRDLASDQKAYIQVMEDLDRRFPEE